MDGGSQELSSIPIARVKGEVLPQHQEEHSGRPIADFFSKISEVLPVVAITKSEGLQVTDEVTLRPKSEVNGRTFRVETPDNLGVWEDPFGTFYSSMDIKGSDFRDPYLIPEGNLNNPRFIINGLLDNGEVGELANISKTLRGLGVETERFELVATPKTVVLDGQELAVPEFKKALLQRAVKTQIDQLPPHKEPLFESWKPNMEKSINEFTPVEVVRSSQVESSLADIMLAKSEEEFRTRVAKVFTFINTRDAEIARKNGQEPPPPWNADNDTDIQRYYSDYLPKRIALNFAKLHNSGIIHGNPSAQNISEVGSLRDLATCRGAAIGRGPEPGIEQLWLQPGLQIGSPIGENDLAILITSLDWSFTNPDGKEVEPKLKTRMGNLEKPIREVKPWLEKVLGSQEELVHKFWANFYLTYLKEFHYEKFLGFKDKTTYRTSMINYASFIKEVQVPQWHVNWSAEEVEIKIRESGIINEFTDQLVSNYTIPEEIIPGRHRGLSNYLPCPPELKPSDFKEIIKALIDSEYQLAQQEAKRE